MLLPQSSSDGSQDGYAEVSPSPSLTLTNEELVDIMTSATGKLKLDW